MLVIFSELKKKKKKAYTVYIFVNCILGNNKKDSETGICVYTMYSP